MREALNINFDSSEVIANPYPVYEEIRAAGRVVRNDLLGVWMVPGYQDVLSVLHDPARYSNALYGAMGDLDILDGATIMINADPPEHTSLRRVAYDAFRRSSVAKLEGTVTQVVDDLLDAPTLRERWADGHEVDVVDALCRPVPATVIAVLLGVPLSDLPSFITWSEDLSAVMDSGQRTSADWPETVARAEQAGAAMRSYLKDQIDLHRRTEHDDLINDLLEANEHGSLDDRQILATLILLLIAGNETTTKLIGAGLRLLASHPDQRQALVDDPGLMPRAVDEILRFEGVTALLPRQATEDNTLADVDVKSGEAVLLLNGAANRDPAAFPEPTRFDIRRSPNPHVAFGHGIHHCLGNQLARLESQLALSGFLRRFPGYQVGEFRFRPVFLARGLDSMQIAVN
jgi:cytochrome P450